MSNRARIELDFCFEGYETIAEALTAFTATQPNVITTVVTETGPAGGWPVVAFEGLATEIVVLIVRYHNPKAELDELMWHLRQIQAVSTTS